MHLKDKIFLLLSETSGRMIADKDMKTQILEFLSSKSYKDVAICNLGKLDRAVTQFFIKNKINIKYLIDDTCRSNYSKDLPTYKLNRWNVPGADTIIVLPPPSAIISKKNRKKNREKIKNSIKILDRYTSCPVYSFYDLFKSGVPTKGIKKNYMYLRDLPPEDYAQALCDMFKRRTGKELDLKHPQTLSEKMQWLKLYGNTPLKQLCADKFLVRDWIKRQLGEEFLIPIIGIYDNPEDINWDSLPDEFVIKCNHGSGFNIVVKNKAELDTKECTDKLGSWLSINYAFYHLELHYKNIKPKILIEKMMHNIGTREDTLQSYLFHCYNGKVIFIQVVEDKYLQGAQNAFFTPEWVKQDITYTLEIFKGDVPRPKNLNEMMDVAKKLAEYFKNDFVRVDLYSMEDGTIYFGELTFNPACGFYPKLSPEQNQAMGDMLELSINKNT